MAGEGKARGQARGGRRAIGGRVTCASSRVESSRVGAAEGTHAGLRGPAREDGEGEHGIALPRVTMESIIELQRQEHEEVDRYEQALADILNKQTTGVSLCLFRAWFVRDADMWDGSGSGGES